MNYIRKIDKLNKRIKALEEENGQLKSQIKEWVEIKQKCEFQIKLADKKENEFQKLITELEDEKEKYRHLIQKLRATLNKDKNVYKKAVDDIKKNIQKNKEV